MSLARSTVACLLALGLVSLLTACVKDGPPPTMQSDTSKEQAMAAWNKRADDMSAVRATLQRNGYTSLDRSVQSGQKSAILRTASLNGDCSPRGDMILHVNQQPKHGLIELVSVDDFTNFPKNDPRVACNTRKVRSWVVYYTSEPGYAGGDVVVFEVVELATSAPMRYATFIRVR
jgi:hypothetical protein